MDFEIDLDSECVWLDDAWLNREDLVRKIRTMMDAGNFEIARASQALEALTKALANARLLALRISPEMSDALNQAAQQSGRPVGALAREAIASWLASASAASTQPGVPAPAPAAVTPLSQPLPAPTPTVDQVASTVIGPVPTQLTTEEQVSAEEAAHAVALTPKRPKEGEDVEKRWFDK